MKRSTLVAVMILGCSLMLHAVFPDFYGARSLALGHSLFASGWDINAIYLNPAALAESQASLSAYQFQQSYRDYRGFTDQLDTAMTRYQSGLSGLSPDSEAEFFQELREIWSNPHGISGSKASMPALISRNFGLSVGWVKAGRMDPVATDLFDVMPESFGAQDFESLRMRFTGLNYRQFSMAYALDLSQSMRLGVGLHYLKGTSTRFAGSLTDSVFSGDRTVEDLIMYAWEQSDNKFSRILVDLSLVVSMGTTFQGMLMAKNVGNPRIRTEAEDLELPQRIIAGLSFRPTEKLSVYLNMDLKGTDLWFDGKDVQPFSAGIEASFYQQRVFFRAGIWNDLKEKYFLGSRANIQYGLGVGFRMSRVVIDLGMALDSSGSISGLAASAAFWVR